MLGASPLATPWLLGRALLPGPGHPGPRAGAPRHRLPGPLGRGLSCLLHSSPSELHSSPSELHSSPSELHSSPSELLSWLELALLPPAAAAAVGSCRLSSGGITCLEVWPKYSMEYFGRPAFTAAIISNLCLDSLK